MTAAFQAAMLVIVENGAAATAWTMLGFMSLDIDPLSQQCKGTDTLM